MSLNVVTQTLTGTKSLKCLALVPVACLLFRDLDPVLMGVFSVLRAKGIQKVLDVS